MPRAVRDRPKASGKLAKIEQKIAKANERLREIEAEGRSAQAEVQRLNDALEDHYSQPDHDPEPKALLGERAVALERAEQPWAAKVRGQRRIIEKLEGEAEAFVRSHYGELVAEQEPGAEERRTTLIECLRATEAALVEYSRAEVTATRLAIAGGNTDDVPRLHGGEQLRQTVRQMLAREIRCRYPARSPRSRKSIRTRGRFKPPCPM
jgi:chromosome segregation ATPase